MNPSRAGLWVRILADFGPAMHIRPSPLLCSSHEEEALGEEKQCCTWMFENVLWHVEQTELNASHRLKALLLPPGGFVEQGRTGMSASWSSSCAWFYVVQAVDVPTSPSPAVAWLLSIWFLATGLRGRRKETWQLEAGTGVSVWASAFVRQRYRKTFPLIIVNK